VTVVTSTDPRPVVKARFTDESFLKYLEFVEKYSSAPRKL
jgi:hypothetical protein